MGSETILLFGPQYTTSRAKNKSRTKENTHLFSIAAAFLFRPDIRSFGTQNACFFMSGVEFNEFCAILTGYFLIDKPYQNWRFIMGRQYNKVQKRARRKNYIARVRAKVRASLKTAKKK